MNVIVIVALVLAFAVLVIPGVMACYNHFNKAADKAAATSTRRHNGVMVHKAV